jgi:sugar phosphate isomerase/epimerase
MQRREFVVGLLGAGVACMAPSSGRPSSRGPSVATPSVRPMALQLAPLLGDLARDLDATLAAVRALGVAVVELPSPYAPFDRAPAIVRGALDRAGLAAEGTLVGTGPLYRGWDRALDAARTLGCTRITCAGPSPDERRGPRDWQELLAVFAGAAERAKAMGLEFGIRADAWMLSGPAGDTPLDALLAAASARAVALTLDVRAAREAHVDPLATMARLGARVTVLHVRAADLGATDEGTRLARAGQADAALVVVPDEGPGTGLERAARALDLVLRATHTSGSIPEPTTRRRDTFGP